MSIKMSLCQYVYQNDYMSICLTYVSIGLRPVGMYTGASRPKENWPAAGGHIHVHIYVNMSNNMTICQYV